MSQKKSLFERHKSNFFYSGGGEILKRATKALLMVLLARFLTKEDYGVYNYLLSVIPILGIFTSWGWPEIFKRYIPKYKQEANSKMLDTLIIKGVLSRVGLIVLLVAVFLGGYDLWASFLGIEKYKFYFQLFSVGIAVSVLVTICQVIITSYLNQKFAYSVRVISEFCKLTLFAGLLFLGFGLSYILVAETIVLIITLSALAYFVYSEILSEQFIQNIKRIPKKIKRYGIYGYLNDMGYFFLDVSIDNMIIAKFLGMEFVAVYTIAAIGAKQLRTLVPTSFLRDIVEPLVYSSYSKSPTDQNLNQIFRFLTKINFLILVPLFFLLFFWGEQVLTLVFGPKYTEAYPYLVGLSFFFFMERIPTGYITKAKEKMHIMAISKIFSVYNLVLSIILIEYYGLFGVVFATGSAQLLKQIFIYWSTKRVVNIKFPFTEILLLTLFISSCYYLISLFIGFLLTPGISSLIISLITVIPISLAVIYLGYNYFYFDNFEKGKVDDIYKNIIR